jgi:hypothetical protein
VESKDWSSRWSRKKLDFSWTLLALILIVVSTLAVLLWLYFLPVFGFSAL